MNKNRVVITGLGIVNPLGIGKNDFWEALKNGKSEIKKITRFDTSNFPIKVAGEIKNFDPHDLVPKRMIKKTDRFTHYALAATKMALNDAALSLEKEDPYKCGIFFGNNAGGWDICERGFNELYKEGPEFINPWQATAWFPAAPQGFTSIAFGIKGTSKSFVADRTSGAFALYFAIRSILTGENEVVITGGAEAPITKFGTICYYETGEFSGSESEGCNKLFDKNRSGLVLGEGSAILIFEELEHALKRNAKIYGELTGWDTNTDSTGEYEYFAKCMKKAADKRLQKILCKSE